MDYQDRPYAPKRDRKRERSIRFWRLSQKRMPWYALVVAFCAILLIGWQALSLFDHGISRLRLDIQHESENAFQKEREVLTLAARVRMAQTDQFVINEARTKYGYLFPGEIRFVVVNPEALGIVPPPPQTDEGAGLP